MRNFSFPKSFFLRCLLAFAFIILSYSPGFTLKKEDALEIHFINVGDGDAMLIKFPDHSNFLIDAGRREYGAKIVNYLKSQGVTKINQAILTHPHNNHFGGFPDVINAFAIEQFYINGDDKQADPGYAELMDKIKKRGIPTRIVRRGDVIPSADKRIVMKILHPENLSGSANGNSIVMWLTYGQTSFLFTADIDDPHQDEVIRLYPQLKSVNCLKAPHHGKNVSDTFARFFAGKIIVISDGAYKNSPPRLKALEKYKDKVLRTDQMGDIVVESDGTNVHVRR